MSIWAEKPAVNKISPPLPTPPKLNERTKMSNYNFDAIQSVPFDATSNDMEQILSSLSVSTSSKSDDEFSPIAGSESTRMSSLLQKLGSYFSQSNSKTGMPSGDSGQHDISSCVVFENNNASISPAKTPIIPAMSTVKRHGSLSTSNSSDKSSISANSSHSTESTGQLCSVSSAQKRNIDQCDEMLRPAASTTDVLCNEAGESFTLPRVNLKQSATAGNKENCSVSFERETRKNEKRDRDRISLQYSTDKSGSSGYSSHVCSTSSMDEHIYSEPVIDGLNSKTGNRRNGFRKSGLDNLESSIKNLELHLRQLNRPTLPAPCDGCYHDEKRRSTSSGSDRLPTIMEGIDVSATSPVSDVHCWQNAVDDSLMDIDLDSFLLANEVRARKKEPPRAGLDNPSFIRDDDDEDDDVRDNQRDDRDEGVAVGSTDSDKYRDNNYKCRKYINSCPEDAYNVEGVIGYGNTHLGEVVDKSLSLYLRKCENQVHYQNTKDILEEIREKLDALITSKSAQNDPFDQDADKVDADENNASDDKSLQNNILSLRNDLENYLKLMNRQNEIEIKQFCSGLSKNYKLLTIQQALENRARSRLSDYDYAQKCVYYTTSSSDIGSKGSADSGLEACRELSLYRDCEIIPQFDTVYVHDGMPFAYNHNTKYQHAVQPFHLQPQESMRSSSDSNFHLQRRRDSMCSSCGEVAVIQCEELASTEASTQSTITGTPVSNDSYDVEQPASHIVNNLAMQQPSLLTGYNDKELILDWHRNKPSIWEQYYGSKRLSLAAMKKGKVSKHGTHLTMSYPSTRPESDFTLDSPRAEELRIKMKKEKQFRSRCRIITSFLSLVFFLLTVMTVSLVLTRGKRMFGSML